MLLSKTDVRNVRFVRQLRKITKIAHFIEKFGLPALHQNCTKDAGFSCLVLPEIIFLAQFFLLFGRQRLEIASPTGAEIDLPTPKTAD